MGLTLTQIANDANRYLRNNNTEALLNLPQTDRDEIVKDAVKKYSRVRPITRLEVFAGNNTGFYNLPAAWIEEFSTISEIEHPIEQSPPLIIRPENYFISLMATGKMIRFRFNNPGQNSTFWVKYTIEHTFDSTGTSTVPTTDKDVIAYLSTSLMAQAFSSFFASKATNSLADVEIVGYNTRVAEFNTLAEKYLKMYVEDITDDNTGVYGQIDFVRDLYFNRDDE